MDTDNSRYFGEKKIRDLALTELFRWGFTTGQLNQDAPDGIAVKMAHKYVELTGEAGPIIDVDAGNTVTENCVNIVTAVFSSLGVSGVASVRLR